jgi:hypothetical protein
MLPAFISREPLANITKEKPTSILGKRELDDVSFPLPPRKRFCLPGITSTPTPTIRTPFRTTPILGKRKRDDLLLPPRKRLCLC